MAIQQTSTQLRVQLNNPCNGVQLTTMQTLQEGATLNQIRTPWLADNS